jgi:putative mycofactocin binding protein MftB
MDLERPYALHGQVAIRPEPFGALAYHYGNRRLLFLKSPALVDLVRDLGERPSAAAALDAAGLDGRARSAMAAALGSLLRAEVLVAR